MLGYRIIGQVFIGFDRVFAGSGFNFTVICRADAGFDGFYASFSLEFRRVAEILRRIAGFWSTDRDNFASFR